MTTTKAQKQENVVILRAFLQFKAEELKGLPAEFKAVFRQCGNVTHIIKRVSALKAVEYEVRFLRYGYNIVVTGDDIQRVKAEFIQKAQEAKRLDVSKPFDLAEFIESYKQLFRAIDSAVPIVKTEVDEAATAKLYAGYEEVKPFAGVMS